MNNLLRTLTESQVRSSFPDSDLKLLLTTVKDGRQRQSYDAKLSDPFYDSLEGLLVDLRTITIDNHDAEAFLKPVSKAEVPDYYDVISNPMDFQTMLKKVKQKQYKSKREFKDDLELIWSNCYTYNAAENHHLRQCVRRLKAKGDRLLKYITDRKERTDPAIPPELANNNTAHRVKINGNGLLNGHSRSMSHQRSPSFPTIPTKTSTPTITIKPSTPLPYKKLARRDTPFPDSPAITRTPSGMATFLQLDRELAEASSSKSNHNGQAIPLVQRLQELAPAVECESEVEQDASHSPDDMAMAVDGIVGDKRKLNGYTDHRPRKRTRLISQVPLPLSSERNQPSELWWSAVQSDALLANGLPGIAFPSSSFPSTPASSSLSSSIPNNHAPQDDKSIPRQRKRRKKVPAGEPPKSLLTMMNNNIRTMKRVRHTHAKFAALNLNSSNNEDAEGGAGVGEGSSVQPFGGVGLGVGMGVGVGVEEDGVEVVDDKVDERPWRLKGKGTGIEMGEKNAADCVNWMGGKVLEHAGFQGTSKVALDVLAGVTSEYLLNVGRTIRFLCDKFSKTMSPEEIILHTLFESGASKIQDLERYISDDVERYGTRLTELEKKLVSAYRESTAVDTQEDEGLFDSEDEEDAGVMAIGSFTDALGEDYLGLRELGIAAEFGMSSLSIPKKLLKGKKTQNKLASTSAKPTEPPLPYPLPPPFIPLTFGKVDDQIGLLKPFYHDRFARIAPQSVAPPPPVPTLPAPPSYGLNSLPPSLPGPSLVPPLSGPTINGIANPYTPATANIHTIEPAPKHAPSLSLILPDDLPSPSQMKMGPLGQIVKGGTLAGTSKKKTKGSSGGGKGEGGAVGPGGLSGEGGAPTTAKKKKKGATGVGTGNGRKKKLADAQAQAQAQVQGGQPSPFPAAIIASA